jgi:alpha-L-rhamnosidase
MSARANWTAQMITADVGSAPILRTRVTLAADHGVVVSGRLRATAFGLVDAWVNGVSVSTEVLTPGWTSYEGRLRYADWDVTGLLEPSTTVALAVGNGWYRGRLGWNGLDGAYGPDRAAAAELTITYADGHVQQVVTDETWDAAPSGILADDLYDGEAIDARLLLPQHAHLHDDDAFGAVRTVPLDVSTLEPYLAPPIRRQEEIEPQLLGTTDGGALLLDFGQNLVGWLRIKVRGDQGRKLIVHHAEVLEGGDLSLRPLRSAKAMDTFVLSGGDDVFEPTFTFHGFRYARIAGWPGTPDEALAAIRAVVIGSDLVRTGYFECSHPLLTQLHENVVWGMRGNFIGLPTDCPQRDERLAYVGDLAAFAPTASFLYDVNDFLVDWFRDLNIEQRLGSGQVPLTVPNSLKFEQSVVEEPEGGWGDFAPGPMALWQDGAVWIPWTIYEQSGDPRILEQQRNSIEQYLSYVESALNENGTMTAGYQLGDWLDPAAPPDDPRAARADREVVATACMYRSVALGARIADVLGDHEAAKHRESLARRIRTGFLNAYVSPDGRIRSDAPTVYAVAVAFGLVTGKLAQAAGDRLAELIAEAGHVIATGFIGTPFVLHALSDTGHTDTAYRLITQQQCPSWLYQVSMGATTIWERWDAMLPDGTVNPGEMTSFNHYAFGSVADWMHCVIAGISPLTAGYTRILFAPQPGGGLTSASAELRTPHGSASIRWALDGDDLSGEVLIPEGSRAVLRLPRTQERDLGPGRHEFGQTPPRAGDRRHQAPAGEPSSSSTSSEPSARLSP